MALVLVYYKTTQTYFCSCGEQVPENHKFVQDSAVSRPQYKDMDYECTSCSIIVKIKLQFLSYSSYVPPVPPIPVGDTWGWGSNQNGCIGDNSVVQRDDPVQVHGIGNSGFLSGMIYIRGGGGALAVTHNMGVRVDNVAPAWGEGSSGQLGQGANLDSHFPITPILPSVVVEVGAGGQHSLYLLNDGTVWSTGDDSLGQLGINVGVGTINTPAQVLDTPGTGFLTGIVDIDGGLNCSIACDELGHVWCWGDNSMGQCGQNVVGGQHNTPQQVLGVGGVGFLTNIIKVAACLGTCYALDIGGFVWAWGDNTVGQLGQGPPLGVPPNSPAPVQVKDAAGVGFLSAITKINAGAGAQHALFLDTAFNCFAVGLGTSGQLGDNGVVSQPLPVYVLDPTGVLPMPGIIDIAGGGLHSVICEENGFAFCCGVGVNGELGVGAGPPPTSSLLLQVVGLGGVGFLGNVIKVGAGFASSFALRTA